MEARRHIGGFVGRALNSPPLDPVNSAIHQGSYCYSIEFLTFSYDQLCFAYVALLTIG